jgi:hypothetical protein
MTKLHLVEKKVRMSKEDIIRYQIITHCYINHITLSTTDIDCLVLLGSFGSIELTDFCKKVADIRLDEKLKEWQNDKTKKRPEASPQTIRNSVFKLEKMNLIVKDIAGRRAITLNPTMKIQTQGNILLDFKMAYIGS